MFWNQVATARDVSILILGVQAFAALLVVGAAAYYVVKGLRYLVVRARTFLVLVRGRALLGLSYVGRAAGWVAAPMLWLVSAAAGVRGSALALRRIYRGKRP